jgi:hypothetical protein
LAELEWVDFGFTVVVVALDDTTTRKNMAAKATDWRRRFPNRKHHLEKQFYEILKRNSL